MEMVMKVRLVNALVLLHDIPDILHGPSNF